MKNQSGLNRGAWTRDEDNLLMQCIAKLGEGKWIKIPRAAGLNRCKKSCGLRWLNYLKPDIKRREFEEDEVDLILRLHKLLGNRWSLIAGRLPGRTANDVKNFWHTIQRREKSRSSFSETNFKSQETVKPIILRPKPRKLLLTSSLCSTGDDVIGDQIQLKKNNTLLALPAPAPAPAPAVQDFESLESFIDTNETRTCYNFPEEGLLNEDRIQSENRISCMDLQISEDQLDWWNSFFDNEEVGKTGSGLGSSITPS